MPPLPLRPFQIEDLAFYIHRGPRTANLSDPGVGKTPSVCVYQDYLWAEHGARSAWVMPKSLLQKNYDELLRFTRFTPDDLSIIDGTKQQRAELAALASLPDEAIDLSDPPEIRDWSRAVVGRFYRPVKQSVTLRIDADVLEWLRSHGPGYQTRVNRLLRSVMEHQRRPRRARRSR